MARTTYHIAIGLAHLHRMVTAAQCKNRPQEILHDANGPLSCEAALEAIANKRDQGLTCWPACEQANERGLCPGHNA